MWSTPAQDTQPSSMHSNGAGGDQYQNKHIRRRSLRPIYSSCPAESVPGATKETCEGRPNLACHARMQQQQPNHLHITISPAGHPIITLRQVLHLTQGWPHAMRALPDHIRV